MQALLMAARSAILCTFLCGGYAIAGIEEAFPSASPESQGLDAQALSQLTEIVQGFFDEGDIAGAELLVIKNRRTVLHKAVGWKDADAKTPLECGTLFNVRSMTKPMTGTLAHMLIDEDRLSPDQPVSRYLSSFTSSSMAAVAVDHLMTHTSGLPLTCIDRPLREYADLAAVAQQAVAARLESPPGSKFAYSDAGSDCLGALLQEVSGVPLGELFQYRLFEPLRMEDTFAELSANDACGGRVSSDHAGLKGSWSRFWKPADEPFYPFAMGSQSVYTTPKDYAKFLALWLDRGQRGEIRLLSDEAIQRGWEPVSVMNYASGLPGHTLYYGRMWMLWVDDAQGDNRVVAAFGHGGSDGTYAIAFPKRDLMVLYFTQSRGQQTIPTFEHALDALLLNPDPAKFALLKARFAPEQLRPYLGLYRGAGQGSYSAILVQDGKLAVELVGSQVLTLEPEEMPDHWHLQLVPAQKVTFRRSPGGVISGIDAAGPLFNESVSRLQPAADLPQVEEFMQRRLAAHGTDRLTALGAFRLTGQFTHEKRGLQGTVDDLYRGTDRRKMVTGLGALGTQSLGFDAQTAWSVSPLKSAELSGAMAEQTRLASLGSLLADWRREYREVQVLYRQMVGEEECFVVRTVPLLAPPSTKYVTVESGLLRAEDRISLLPGVGMVGVLVVYEDYRDVEGVQIPFRIRSEAAHPLIGTTVIQYDQVETHLDVPGDAFAMPNAG